MFTPKEKHCLSNTIMVVAMVNFLGELIVTFLRAANSEVSVLPVMANDSVFAAQLLMSFVQLLITCAAFVFAWKKIKKYTVGSTEEKLVDIANNKRNRAKKIKFELTILQMGQLIKIWGGILIVVQIIYEIVSTIYKGFFDMIVGLIDIADEYKYMLYVNLYNSSHGFKYIGMIVAICIGIYITGVILNDKILAIISVVLLFSFVAVFVMMQTPTVVVLMNEIGVVWTSVIFHVIQTLGLFVFALYIRMQYKDM